MDEFRERIAVIETEMKGLAQKMDTLLERTASLPLMQREAEYLSSKAEDLESRQKGMSDRLKKIEEEQLKVQITAKLGKALIGFLGLTSASGWGFAIAKVLGLVGKGDGG